MRAFNVAVLALALAVLGCALWLGSASAWGDIGHKIVCEQPGRRAA